MRRDLGIAEQIGEEEGKAVQRQRREFIKTAGQRPRENATNNNEGLKARSIARV
jgi:hypothetical protein